MAARSSYFLLPSNGSALAVDARQEDNAEAATTNVPLGYNLGDGHAVRVSKTLICPDEYMEQLNKVDKEERDLHALCSVTLGDGTVVKVKVGTCQQDYPELSGRILNVDDSVSRTQLPHNVFRLHHKYVELEGGGCWKAVRKAVSSLWQKTKSD